VLGKVEDDLYKPYFPFGITPDYQKEVARELKLKIETNCIISGENNKLYYYNGKYHRAKELFCKRRINQKSS